MPPEKQSHILDAAISAFSKNGYRKASINDIASDAGISKAMVFYYFGSKKELYMYLVGHCANMIISEINKHLGNDVTDLFDRITEAAEIKMSVIRRHSGILFFLARVRIETDPEVIDDIKRFFEDTSDSSLMILETSDLSKFKEGVDAKLIIKFLTWASEGVMGDMAVNRSGISLDDYMDSFLKCLHILKNNLYREEYL